MSKAIFIEGTDGSGKSVQLKLLKEYLESKGEKLLVLREPGGSGYYEALRDFYLHSPHEHPAISDALLSAAGRAANIADSKAALKNNTWVITDRSYISSYVYQSVQGVPLEDIKKITQLALQGFSYDVKIVLDVPVDIAMKRVENTGAKKDYWESLGTEFFTKIREKYLEIAESEDCTVIDASLDIETVHQQIVQLLGA